MRKLLRRLVLGAVLFTLSFSASALANQPPNPIVYQPLANQVANDDNTLFEFGISDPEGLALYSYQMQVASDSGFTNILIQSPGDFNWYIHNTLPAGHRGYVSDKRLPDNIGSGSPYYWRVKVQDRDPSGSAGLWSDWSAPVPFYVDNATPEVHIDDPQPWETVNTLGRTLRWTYWDPKGSPQATATVRFIQYMRGTVLGSKVLNSADNSWLSDIAVPLSYRQLSLGLEVVNQAGLTSKGSLYLAIISFYQVPIRGIPSLPIDGQTFTIPVSHFAWTFESASATTQTEYRLQVSTDSTFATTLHDIANLSADVFCDLPQPIDTPGQYYWRVGVNDGSQPSVLWSAPQSFVVANSDTTPPVTTHDYPSDGQWVKIPVTIHLTATDDNSGVRTTYYRINGGAQTEGTTLQFTSDGAYTAEYWSEDNAGNTEPAKTVTVKLDQSAPAVQASVSPPPNAAGWNNSDVTVQFLASDAFSGVANVTAPVSVTTETAGQVVEGSATDVVGNTASTSVTVKLDKTAPALTNFTPKPGTYFNIARPAFTVSVTDGLSGVSSGSAVLVIDGATMPSTVTLAQGVLILVPAQDLGPGKHTAAVEVSDQAGNEAAMLTTSFTVDLSMPTPPPDPAEVAPPVNPSVPTDISSANQFLFTGASPIQTGVSAGTIKPQQMAVLRGKVLDRDGQPLPGAIVSVLAHPEFGQTISRQDGMFDLAVNGGTTLSLVYRRNGYIGAQRQIQAPWQDYAVVPDAVLTQVDPQANTVLQSNPQGQVARGSQVTDSSGTRQATLFFAPGTQVTNLVSQTLTVRATEFTVGDNGPKAMPAPLPPTTAYTYAVDLSIDEAAAEGVSQVNFSQPVFFYVENFLNFPVGIDVPSGFYDQGKGAWVPSQNGRIIRILGVTGGLADVDVTGSGLAADSQTLSALGFTDAERLQLAVSYAVGQSLWRVPVDHFSWWDFNWGWGAPSGAAFPPPGGGCFPPPPPNFDCSNDNRSTLEIQSQVLHEAVPLTGTPYTLNYSSDRVLGRKGEFTLDIPLSGDTIPASCKRIELEVRVAGRLFTWSFPAQTNQRYTFEWDGQDAYGRTVQGGQRADVRVGYTYDGTYQQTWEFGYNGNGNPITGSRTRMEVTLWRFYETNIGVWDARGYGLGGWTLSPHHAYSPESQTLYLGTGERRSGVNLNKIIKTLAGNGSASYGGDGGPAAQASLKNPIGLAGGSDGSVFVADGSNYRVRKIGADGLITTFAGNGSWGYTGDGGPATEARLNSPSDVAVGSDGSVYIADTSNHRVRRVSPSGIISTVAGNGSAGFSGDGGPATAASLKAPTGVAVAADGTLYIADHDNHRVRRVGPDGVMSTVAGTGAGGFSGDGGPAAQAQLYWPTRLAIGLDGSVYVADNLNNRIRRISPDGTITTVAGSGTLPGFSGDGGQATQATLWGPEAVTVGPDGTLYITDTFNNRIRRVGPDGVILTVAGLAGSQGFAGDDGPANQAKFAHPRAIAVSPDGSIYLSDTNNQRVRQITSTMPGFNGSDIALASADGTELYKFNASGRHLQTVNTLTGATKYTFGYDDRGYLTQVTDGDGNVTAVERDTNGDPTAIVGPFGQHTTLTVNGDRYLTAVTNPANETKQFTYGTLGLLATAEDPLHQVSTFSYDGSGLLTKDEDPLGGYIMLARTPLANGWEVTKTEKASDTQSYVTTYRTETLPTGETHRVVTGCCGNTTETLIGTDGSWTVTDANGTVTKTIEGPDPRFGMQAPLVTSLTVTTPGGKVYSATATRVAVLANLADPLSLQSLTDTVVVNGHTTTSVFNVAVKTLTVTSPTGRQTVTTVDTQGRTLGVQIPGLAPTSLTYDSYGRLHEVTTGTAPDTRTTTITYGQNGFVESIVDPLLRSTSFVYDGAGRILTQNLPGARQVSFGYDLNGNLTSLTPPGRPSHGFEYTAVDLESVYAPPPVDAEENRTVYEYNLARRPVLTTRPDGQTIGLEYDTSGRLLQVTIPDGTVTYVRDAATGNLTNILAPDGSLSYGYDGSLLTRATWGGTISGEVTATYDNNLRVTSQSVNAGHTISFVYDNDGLLTQAGAETLARDPQNGRLTGTTLGSLSDSRTYNDYGELSDYEATYNGTSLLTVSHTTDSFGRIDTRTETFGGETHLYAYTYDQAGRLTDVQKDGVLISHYDYDANGNRAGYSGPGGTLSATYDDQDRLVSYGAATYEYTANGELLTKTDALGTTTYTYDVLGNLQAVALPDGTQIEYLIDGQNRRTGKKVNGVLVQGFLYQDQLAPVAELDGSGNVVSRFVYATRPNVPEYMVKGGVTYRIITDNLGSPHLVVDASTGQVVQRMDYDEFGNVVLDTNPGFQPFGFAGGLYDRDTRFVRFGARDYDPETGRWTAKDPIGFMGRETSLYSYGQSDPVDNQDPIGLAYIGSRPLGSSWIPFNGQGLLRHDNIWYDNGSNSGFFEDDSIRSDRGHSRSEYDFSRDSRHYDDNLMSQAEKAVSGYWDMDWSLYSHDCQDYADAVRKEYSELLKRRNRGSGCNAS